MAESSLQCSTCARPKRANAPCLYCGRSLRDGLPPAVSAARVSAAESPRLPSECANCQEPRPRGVARDADGFRCFNCGAVTRVGGAQVAASEPLAAGDASRPSVSARQLQDNQHEAFAVIGWVGVGFVAALLVVGALCVAVSKTATTLMVLNRDPTIAALALAPLLAIQLTAVLGFLRVTRARRRFEDLFAAILPRDAGAMLRCHGCGNALRQGSQKLVRCASCRSDNLASTSIARRAGKTEVHLDADGAQLFADEVAYRHDVLHRVRSSAKRWTLLLPGLALLVYLGAGWLNDWRLPLFTVFQPPQYAVVTAPDCNLVIKPDGPVTKGWVKTRTQLRGQWARRAAIPAVYDHTLVAQDFVGKRATTGRGASGPITAVFRRVQGREPWLRIDTGAEPHEQPILLSCIEEANPHRTTEGFTAEELRVAKAKSEAQRKLMQGQVHAEDEPAAKGGTP